MRRPIRLVSWGLTMVLVLAVSGCGGGGGGTSSTGVGRSSGDPPTATPTPLRSGSGRNERTESNSAGSMTLRVSDVIVGGGQTLTYSVELVAANGKAAIGQTIKVESGFGLNLLAPPDDCNPLLPSPQCKVGSSDQNGFVSGSAEGVAGGTFFLTVTAVDAPFNGLSVTLGIVVVSTTPTSGVGPTATPTALPCQDIQTIIVQTGKLSISSQSGGDVPITAVVFDSNNMPVPQVNVLFDVQPRIASFNPLTQVTDDMGIAATTMTVPPNSSYVGPLIVSGSACSQSGMVSLNVVSGVSTKPVATVVLQADPASVGSLTGGNVNLTAAVLDSDNQPINGIDVLFITSLGRVNPLTDRTKISGAQGGIATSVLQVPASVVEQPYPITALAGGVSGSTIINVIPGRGPNGGGNTNVPPGMPAGITLGASPTRLQVSGTGGTDLATVLGRVFDNAGNPLAGAIVRYHVVTAQSAPGAVILPLPTAVPTAPAGTPVPTPTTLCAPDDPFAVSDTAGFATITLRAGSQPGPVTVAACADTVISGVPSPLIEQQALVTVTSGPVNRIGLTINSKSIDNNDGTLLTTASAVVTDAQGNTVEDGVPVFFEILCAGGSCLPGDPSLNIAISSNSTTNGVAPCDVSQFIVQTGTPISPQPGDAITCIKYPLNQQGSEVLVKATVGGVSSAVAGTALTLPGRLGDLEVSVSPSTVKVSETQDGLAVVQVQALDDNLAGVQNVRVRFFTSVGSIDKSVLTDAMGEASATLTIPAGTPSGKAILRVAGGGVQVQNIEVPFINTGGGATPTPGAGTEPAAIQFISAVPATIGVSGSGLPEQSMLTFMVTDGLGRPAGGVIVNFSLAKVSDESIAPLQGVTDADGTVRVTLTSGQRALSVQVTAEVTTPSGQLVTRSTTVNILGGPPSQPNFSLAHEFNNISGRVTFGLENTITAFVGDRFGNPVPPGTTVSFTTQSGAIGNPTGTNALGQATATLVSQAPLTPNGIVATLATTRGERPFVDTNGSGVCDDGVDQLLPVSEPFYDANCDGKFNEGEQFIDLNDNGKWDSDQGPGTPTCADQLVIFESICTTFSAPTSLLLLTSGSGPIEAGGGRDYTLIVSDNPDPLGNPGVGNPIVGGSTVSVTINGSRGRVLGLNSFTIPDAQTNDVIVDGLNRFRFSVVDNAAASTMPETDAVIVTVTSGPGTLPAGGNGSGTVQDVITFLAAPTPTPTITAVPTETPVPTAAPSATPSPLPPAIAPSQTSLSAGSGAPPNACNGASQSFVVTGGAAPFTVSAGGGCASVTSVPASGGSFLFTAGNLIGNFTITVTDALGRSASAGVQVLGPPTPTVTPPAPPTNTVPPGSPTPAAAFIQLDLIANQAASSGDGTFTTVIGALVTDSTGAVVGDGVPIVFSLQNPMAGVSVTSPGLTGMAAPCSLGFTVVPQPGDALSCVKYVQSLAGTTITVVARVDGVSPTSKTILLPDLRPTATPTQTLPTNTPIFTSTPSNTPLPTNTATVTPTSTNTPTVTP